MLTAKSVRGLLAFDAKRRNRSRRPGGGLRQASQVRREHVGIVCRHGRAGDEPGYDQRVRGLKNASAQKSGYR